MVSASRPPCVGMGDRGAQDALPAQAVRGRSPATSAVAAIRALGFLRVSGLTAYTVRVSVYAVHSVHRTHRSDSGREATHAGNRPGPVRLGRRPQARRHRAGRAIGDDEVLVRVHAASIHVGDWILMTGSPFVMRLATGLRKPKNRGPGNGRRGHRRGGRQGRAATSTRRRGVRLVRRRLRRVRVARARTTSSRSRPT